jgi:exopolyphosphatase / guanosine-5'-triphosphate,3'-diphosphate pyrophosphatase
MKERVAVIDLGTNTFHLLVAERDGNKINMLYREKQPVKIGMGGINQGIITEEAILRGVACLKKFTETLKEWKVVHVQAFGTSALRGARNGKEVIQKLKKETGIETTLISGEEEAGYIYLGVRSALDLGLEKSLIIDIGGGSVEFIIGNNQAIDWKQSFDIGAQRLLELFHPHDPIHPEDIKNLEIHFNNSLTALHHAIQIHSPSTLVGSSGTFDTLSEIYCHRNHLTYSSDAGETPLTMPEYEQIHKEFTLKNRAQRLQIPGMIEMRVDMIVVASCLIRYLLSTYHFKNIRVSSYSLKEGALAKGFGNF